ncbi:STAS domain-containing protein [Tepidimonas aquatica]|uniref:STAS domain protein n=1 Tax=Tepidimonas aquatica TaxID=247482 RepID=A0A554WHQ1_9BURK|nr:STAS domain-containing protein [Tepidimonas aquatica]TSE23118.1 STAS domain protein [Tepidimonas aquatica]
MEPKVAGADAPPRGWAALVRWWRRWRDSTRQVRGLQEERAALQAALQRRRHHDEVRRAELQELRALLRQQRGEAAPAPPRPPRGDTEQASAWPLPATPRSGTMEQIARIEAHMAQQWGGVPTAPPHEAAPATAERAAGPAEAGAARVPRLAIDIVHPDPRGAVAMQAWLGHPALTELAVAFANGRFEVVQRGLQTMLQRSDDALLACVAGRLKLDLLWALCDREGYDAWAAQWAQRCGQPVLPWPVQVPATPATPGPQRVWRCPARLRADDVQAWATHAEPDGLDWRALETIDAAAAAVLLPCWQRWADEPRVLTMAGTGVLLRRLKEATPSGRADVEPMWWRLRLAALRLLDRRASYELVALDAYATAGLVLPPWQAPRALVVEVQALPEPAAVAPVAVAEPVPVPVEAADEHDFPAMATALADWVPSQPASIPTPTTVALEGVLCGDIGPVLARLDDALLRHEAAAGDTVPLLHIDAQGLRRLDFAAVGALLQWLLAARARGVRTEWHGVAPLVGLLLHTVGIDQVAEVRLRQ